MKVSTRLSRKKTRIIALSMCVVGAVASSPVFAGPADVLDVQISRSEADIYRFSVTVRHEDEGWKHYADRWDVLDQDGNILGTRVLMHPHENEQPFTRSMKLSVPMHVKKVIVRARDKKHGYGGKEMTVDLPN